MDETKECKRITAACELVRDLNRLKSERGKITHVLNWIGERPWKGCRCGCSSK